VDVGEGRAARLADIEPGRYVRLIVADTGAGMSEEVQTHPSSHSSPPRSRTRARA